jgi:hypothetical protein
MMREPLRAGTLNMTLTPQESAVLDRFRSATAPTLRFAQVWAVELDERARAIAVTALVRKGILARLGNGGEYWLTDVGVQALGLSLVA